MTYVSLPNSGSALHLEYAELYSVNYIVPIRDENDRELCGAKGWLLIAPGQVLDYEEAVSDLGLRYPCCKQKCTPKTTKSCRYCGCPHAVFHESYTLPHSNFLNKHRIAHAYLLQRPGDFVIIRSTTPHMVESFGVTIAESRNFFPATFKGMHLQEYTCYCYTYDSNVRRRMNTLAIDQCNQKYPCTFPGCKLILEFPTKASLNYHYKFDHKLSYSCDICDKKFAHASSLSRHRSNNHKGKVFYCVLCMQIFATENALTEHNRIFHFLVKTIVMDPTPIYLDIADKLGVDHNTLRFVD